VDWCHTIRENAKIRDMEIERKGFLVFLHRKRKKKREDNDEKIAEIIFILKATLPIGMVEKILPIRVKRGYPVGWTIPSVLQTVINSPASIKPIFGLSV